MRSRSLRRLTAVTALALASMAAAAACTSTSKPTTPGPTTGPASSAPATAIPTPAATAVPVKPVRVPGTRPIIGSKCLGTIVHRINAGDQGPPWRPLCITVGAVLRFDNLGPGSLRMVPPGKADCWYEGGVHECRLVQTGTVRVTVNRGDQTRVLTLVIAKAPADPGPDPACPRVATHTLDAADFGPRWPAICMRLDTMIRILNFGPDGFTVSPAANVSGWYQDNERQFTFVKTGTVTFALTYPDGGTRTFTVVVVR